MELGAVSYKVLQAKKMKEEKKETKPVARGQYVVSHTRCPALHDCPLVLDKAGQWPRMRRSTVEHRGTLVRPARES